MNELKTDPYSYLKCDDDFELPNDWIEALGDIPEKGVMRVLASLDKSILSTFGNIPIITTDPDHGPLKLAEREFIGVIVSSQNRCLGCTVVHGYMLGELIGDHAKVRRLSVNYRTAELTKRERAIADYAVKLTVTPSECESSDVDKLREAGLSEHEIYAVAETVASFNFTNRMGSGLGWVPDEAFLKAISPAEGIIRPHHFSA